MKRIMPFAFAAAVACAAGAFTVSDVSARQRWPWNGLVDVDFKIGGSSVADLFKVEVRATYAGGAKKLIGRTYLEEPLRGPGWNRITWDLGADCPEFKTEDLQVAVVATPVSQAQIDAQDVYMVIDLASGPNSTRYPVRYTTTAPTLVPTNDYVACAADPNRTTKLWLKRVPACHFPFGGTSTGATKEVGYFEVYLSPYYIGIFELTQGQWNLVMDTWPSVFSNTTYRAARPVSNVNYEDVIGHNNWPSNKTVGDETFVGRMRARTGLATLNLPTESQWEAACRAGRRLSSNTSAKFRYKSDTTDYMAGPETGTALVGSYPPNAWGFYDFYGNVHEMSLDAYATSDDLQTLYAERYGADGQIIDPIGPSVNATARYHATRGGAFYNSEYCNNYSRNYGNRSETGTRHRGIGLRIAVSPEWE